MNLLDSRKAGLITVLALFLFACESDNLISLPFDPKTENINAQYTELTLPFKLVQLDSVNTTNRKRYLIGNYLNDNFGTAKAVGFAEIGISNKGSVTAEDVFDSLSLIMVNDYFYGEAGASLPQTFSVCQLTDTLARRTYYSFETAAYQNPPLGTFTFSPDTGAVTANDTIHVRLSDALGRDLFEKAKNNATELSTDSTFREFFKGLAFIPGSENRYMTGFNPAGMRLVLYYSTPSETTSSEYIFAPTRVFNHMEYDRSGSPVVNIVASGEKGQATDGKFYVQSGTGLSPLIDFQPLVDFIKNIKNSEEKQYVLLNSVVFYLGTTATDPGTPLPAALRGYEVDENFKRKVVYSASARQEVFTGLFADNSQRVPEASAIQPDSLQYRTQVTNYMQLLADNSLTETELLLLADDFESSVNQIVAAPDSVKLKVYYTVLK